MDGEKGNQSVKLAILVFHPLLALLISTTPANALNIGVQSVDSGINSSKQQQCSRTCRSQNCNCKHSPLNFISQNIFSQSILDEQLTFFVFDAIGIKAPPLLKYGKNCGILYSACPKEKPCDALDACCETHDNCIGSKNNDYLNVECNEAFLSCMAEVRNSGKGTFKGSKCTVEEVVDVITPLIEVAVLAGRALHKT